MTRPDACSACDQTELIFLAASVLVSGAGELGAGLQKMAISTRAEQQGKSELWSCVCLQSVIVKKCFMIEKKK